MIFPNATHAIPFDDPALFNATIDRFLRTRPVASGLEGGAASGRRGLRAAPSAHLDPRSPGNRRLLGQQVDACWPVPQPSLSDRGSDRNHSLSGLEWSGQTDLGRCRFVNRRAITAGAVARLT